MDLLELVGVRGWLRRHGKTMVGAILIVMSGAAIAVGVSLMMGWM